MKRDEIKILLYGANIWYLAEGMFGPLLAVFTEEIGGNILDISGAWATYLIFYGVLSIFIGKMADNTNGARIMVWGYFLNALLTFGYVFVESSVQLFVLQAGLGIAGAMATPTWNALFDKYSDNEINGTAWGLADGTASIVTGVAVIVGSLLVKYFSFDTLFIIMGIIHSVAAIYQAKILNYGKT